MNYVQKFDSGLFSAQGAFSGAGESFSVDVHPRSHALGHGGPDTIVVPDAHLLFSGDYKRSGLDLVLSKDGHEFVARDYFRGESRSVLASPDGASLSGSTVEALAGQVDYAQAGGAIAPAKIIGQVTKVTGSATAVRNGVSITLNVGDNVHKGDVVQSGSDSSLGITFIDGTVFGLSSNARMVLNEMIYDPAGSSNASLLTLVQGTISFVAGATAKTGDMKVETPTATMGIRGTAVLVEIDFDVFQPGLAPPVSFRILVEPNGETGEYVLLDRLTGQPIATVNQPGTKTVVNGQGAVTFFPSAEIPANAQRLINEIFTLKFTDANPKYIGIPPLDTITPQSFLAKLPDGTPIDQLPIIRITLVLEPVAPPPPSGGNTRFHLNIPPDLLASSNQFTERLLTTGNTALDTVSGVIHFDDINPEDRPTVSAQFNSYVYRDAQQEVILTSSLTLEQLAAIQAVQVPLSVVQHPDNTNVGDGTWTYRVPDQALDFLAEGETLTLIYMARVDTNYIGYNTVVFTPFKITITGSNDLPTAAATGSGIIELDGTNNPDINHAEGVITFTDVDLTDRPTVTAPFANYVYTAANGSVLTLTPAQQAALAATLTLTPAQNNTNNGSVAWSYDVADSNFDFIAAGETLVLTYHATVDDGHGGIVTVPLTLTVSVNGTNDIPTITATSDSFIELVGTTGNASPDHAGGTITFTDVDLTDRPTVSAAYASFFTYSNAQNVDITSTLTTSHLAAIAAVHPVLSLEPLDTNANNGKVAWSYELPDNSFDFLAQGETLSLSYTATVDDGHGGIASTPFTVTITGSNDVPVAIGDANATDAVVESGVDPANTPSAGDPAAAGNVLTNDTDVDINHVLTVAAVAGGAGNVGMAVTGIYGSVTIGADGNYTYTLNNTDPDTQALAHGAVATDVFSYTVTDEFGATSTADLTITITGTNDAPVASGDGNANDAVAEAGVNQANTPFAGDAAAVGNVLANDTDVDTGHVLNVAAVAGLAGNVGMAVTGIYGSVTIGADGSYTYALDNNDPDTDALAQDAVVTDVFSYTVTDQFGATSTADLTITITGTNDAPVASGDSNANDAVAEAGVNQANTPFAGDAAAAGNVLANDTDVDTGHVLNVAAVAGLAGNVGVAVTGIYGLVTIYADGSYNYALDNNDPDTDALAQDAVVTDVFSYTVTDQFGATSTADLTITITGTNDAPVANEDTNASDIVVESGVNPANTPFAGDPTAVGNVLTNDTDVDTGNVLTVAAVAGLAGNVGTTVTGIYGSITIAADGSYAYTLDDNDPDTDALAQDAVVTDVFSYTVTDQFGATSTADLTITITGTNDAPVANGDTNASDAVVESGVDPLNTSFAGDPAAAGNVLTNDTDVDTGNVLTVAAVAGLAGNVGVAVTGIYGLVTIYGDGSYNYALDNNDPDTEALAQGAVATDVFSYTVTDEFGATSTADLTITITGTNDAPMANEDTNASDIVVESGVNPANTPFAGDPTAVGNVLTNDTDVDTGNVLTVAAVAGLAGNVGTTVTGIYGSITIAADGSYAYTLNNADPDTDALAQGAVATDVFSYTVTDEFGATSTADLTITITGTNDAPVANGDTNASDAVLESGIDPLDTSFAGDPAAAGNVLTNDTDVDTGNVLTVAAVAGLAGNVGMAVTGIYGFVTIYADGSYNYALDNNDPDTEALAQGAVATDVFSYTVTDEFGATSIADLTITITGSNDAPVIATAGLQISGNGSTVTGLSVSDVDASSTETFTVTTATSAQGSSVTNLAAGTLANVNAALNTGLVYDPGQTPPQTDMISLTVEDASGASDTVNFIFNVTDPVQGNAVTLASTSGNDVLFGTGYEDQFVFAADSRHDTIIDFTAGIDHIDLTALSSIVTSATLTSFMTTNVTPQGNDILITLDGADTITLRNPTGSLSAGDFIVQA